MTAPHPALITKAQLKEWSACRDGYEWFLRQYPTGEAAYADVYPALMADKRRVDADWLFEWVFGGDNPSVDQSLATVVRFAEPSSRHHELLIDSNKGSELQLVRSRMSMDWLIRTHLPAWLELSPTLAKYAAELRALAPITDDQTLAAAMAALDKARMAAAAARAAALAAAWDAARAAALAAALAAAWDAAWAAAWAAAWDAAQNTEGDYVTKYEAARAVADALLQPTQAKLADQAKELCISMINARLADAAALDRADEVQP